MNGLSLDWTPAVIAVALTSSTSRSTQFRTAAAVSVDTAALTAC